MLYHQIFIMSNFRNKLITPSFFKYRKINTIQNNGKAWDGKPFIQAVNIHPVPFACVIMLPLIYYKLHTLVARLALY